MAQGLATFDAGPATVVGLARSSINGHATDAHVQTVLRTVEAHCVFLKVIGAWPRTEPTGQT